MFSPKTGRGVQGAKSSRSPGGIPQPSSGGQWDNIVKFLDSLMSKLRGNHSGLAELEKWIVNAKEELHGLLSTSEMQYAGTSWHELNYIRQAVGFLVIHQKRKKSLEEIRQDLCPALTVRQIYRISTMYWDDKYGTQSVSNEASFVVSVMREIVSKDNQNLTSNSFLLDDDLSIPFSAEDIDMAIPAIDLDEIHLPEFVFLFHIRSSGLRFHDRNNCLWLTVWFNISSLDFHENANTVSALETQVSLTLQCALAVYDARLVPLSLWPLIVLSQFQVRSFKMTINYDICVDLPKWEAEEGSVSALRAIHIISY
ncbi:hypothetical protein V8G54_036093 [Vigna mungo]|uniref:Dilute domain-containing protein n=1 Tax=Vigna mungo TaxID=3915 RepID=A0AAQ3MG66_VIGMU